MKYDFEFDSLLSSLRRRIKHPLPIVLRLFMAYGTLEFMALQLKFFLTHLFFWSGYSTHVGLVNMSCRYIVEYILHLTRMKYIIWDQKSRKARCWSFSLFKGSATGCRPTRRPNSLRPAAYTHILRNAVAGRGHAPPIALQAGTEAPQGEGAACGMAQGGDGNMREK